MHHAKQSPDDCRWEPAAHLVKNAESALVVHVVSAGLGAVELRPGLAPHLGQEQLAAHGTQQARIKDCPEPSMERQMEARHEWTEVVMILRARAQARE